MELILTQLSLINNLSLYFRKIHFNIGLSSHIGIGGRFLKFYKRLAGKEE